MRRFLAESDIRSDEVSCEKVTANVAKSYGLQRGGHNHHLVQDGLRLLNLPRGEDGSLSPESLNIMHSTINKLSNGALQSVAKIISRTNCSFNKTRPLLREIVTYHLPCYLAKLDHEDVIMFELSEILRNPGSYQSDSLSLVTPVSPLLLSSINQALDRLDGIPDQALVAVNRKLIGKTCMPKFWHVPRSSSRGHLIEIVRKRCKMIIARIEEGYMPKRLAKAMSVVNLYWKQKLRSMDISQLEYFPFSKETVSLQNDILNALWLLPKLQHDDLKLLRPILDPDPKFRKMQFRVSLRKYLLECLFESDEGDLPDEAHQAIAFINRISQCESACLTERRKNAEVDSVLNVSSQLRALAYYDTDDCSDADKLMSLGSVNCTGDNDFVLPETNYFHYKFEQHMDEPCSSNSTPKVVDMDECCSAESTRAAHHVQEAEHLGSKLEEVFRKPCEGTENSGATPHYRDNLALEEAVDTNHLKTPVHSKDLSEICDETSTAAYMLIGQILDKWLLVENGEVEELTRHYLGGGLVSEGPQDTRELLNVTDNKNLKGDILVHAVERILPNLPRRNKIDSGLLDCTLNKASNSRPSIFVKFSRKKIACSILECTNINK
ncbi:uncharacterized protein LOC125513720 isoform X4 [Triticum urartu]|uniref:uncharacterized protein LOC125513720 isoform X4 n=1 Tax=Triticum urartu TaxID=4572 RepID=UPI0020438285|nr:uncharacterized protein LOC125513720 isoform X4 [Triticum urartu]